KGGRKDEVLHPVKRALHTNTAADLTDGEFVREAVHRKDAEEAERNFARLAHAGPDRALNELLFTVQDNTEVHRVVLPYRAWDLLGLIGKEQAHTLLRQSVRYCVKAESWPRNSTEHEPRNPLPKGLVEHKLLDHAPGTRKAEY